MSQSHFYIILLIFFAIGTHIEWFVPESVIAWGDWYYWHDETASELYRTWGTWLSLQTLGSPNIQLPFLLFKSLWSFIIHSGMSFNVAAKLTFFIPIALLSFLSPYFLFNHLIKKPFIAFVAAMFYGTTTYGLFVQPPIQFLYAFTPIVLLLFIRALERNTLTGWLLFLLSYSLGVAYEIRIMVIVTGLLGLYFLLFRLSELKKYVRYFLLVGLLFVLINLYWLLPILFGQTAQAISDLTTRRVFGDNLYTLPHAFTLFNWLWTGGYPNKEFVRQPIFWYFWIFPIIAFSTFLFKTGSLMRRYIIYFGLIALIGIFLTKQSAAPFPSFYSLAYRYIPGFNLYREASKFYLLTAIGYAGLITYLLFLLDGSKGIRKRLFGIVAAVVIVTALLNTKPLITREIGTLFVGREIPSDYKEYKTFIRNHDSSFRTLWVPYFSRWSYFDAEHPEISIIDLMHTTWSTVEKKRENSTEGQSAIALLNNERANILLDTASIRYVLVPMVDKRNDDNFISSYFESRQYYVDSLRKVPYLREKETGLKDLSIFENYNYKPPLYLTDEPESLNKTVPFTGVKYRTQNPSTYIVSVDNIKSRTYLHFANTYHPEWRIRVGNFSWIEALISKDYFLPQEHHAKNPMHLNTFIIDPKKICKTYSCSVENNTYSLTLTLFYFPQAYFYLGLLGSSFTAFGILLYLALYAYRKLSTKKLIKKI